MFIIKADKGFLETNKKIILKLTKNMHADVLNHVENLVLDQICNWTRMELYSCEAIEVWEVYLCLCVKSHRTISTQNVLLIKKLWDIHLEREDDYAFYLKLFPNYW